MSLSITGATFSQLRRATETTNPRPSPTSTKPKRSKRTLTTSPAVSSENGSATLLNSPSTLAAVLQIGHAIKVEFVYAGGTFKGQAEVIEVLRHGYRVQPEGWKREISISPSDIR